MDIRVIASGSKGNAYLISDGVTSILIEAGVPVPVIQKAIGFKLSEIAGVFISHEHNDHAQGAKRLLERGLPVYMTDGTRNALSLPRRAHRTLERDVAPLGLLSEDYLSVIVGTFVVQPFETVHDAAEPVGFWIWSSVTDERLVFVTDSAYIKHTFQNVDYFLVECNHSEEGLSQMVRENPNKNSLRNRIRRNHLSVENATEWLRKCGASKAKRIYLLHLSDANSDELGFKNRIEKAFGVETIVC